jgi:hypothetical protein
MPEKPATKEHSSRNLFDRLAKWTGEGIFLFAGALATLFLPDKSKR